jgi:hypothetical protein
MKIRDWNFTLGADPEIFIYNKKTKKPICPFGLIPGTKAEPVKMGKHGNTVQLDGMAAEIGIPPCGEAPKFVNQIEQAKEDLQKLIGKDYGLMIKPTAEFGKKVLDEAPQECKELGCNPDYNAYISVKDNTGKKLLPEVPMQNPRPNGEKVTFRTGGGHVHVGWSDKPVEAMHPDHLQGCRLLTVAMDLFLGVPSVAMDYDVKRRLLYGKAGAFRPKPYGMEWRSSSNWWLESPQYSDWVFESTITAVNALWNDKRRVISSALEVARRMIDNPTSPSDIMTLMEKNPVFTSNKKWFEKTMEMIDV